MKRILITGAGGSPATNFVRSLRRAGEKIYLVGTDVDPYYLIRAETDKKYLIPPTSSTDYLSVVNYIIKREGIDFIHAQNDVEVGFISANREKISAAVFLPTKETVIICQDKFKSYDVWRKAGLIVPETLLIKDVADLKNAFSVLGEKIWIRAISGAGGRGSLAVDNLKTAESWIDFHDGWGQFTASEFLSDQTVTWMSLWHRGQLIVAQGRKRLYWELSKISPSGVTGVTGAGLTVEDPLLDEIAIRAIRAIDSVPHGLFGVDLTYNRTNVPNPTEINIGRFFTTHHFFTALGLNMPYLYIKLGYNEVLPEIKKIRNPLEPGHLWIRGVDFEPLLSHEKEIINYREQLERVLRETRKMKILLTGATGFVGKLLAKDADFAVSGRDYDISQYYQVEALKQKIGEVEQLVHLAAYVPKSVDDDLLDKSFQINVIGVVNLLKVFGPNLKSIILVSTVEAYEPRSYYAASKLMSEILCQSYAKQNKINLTILRLTTLYGAGDTISRAIPSFLKAASRAEPLVIYGSGEDVRDYLYVDDAARAIRLAMEKDGDFGVIDIASGKGISINQLAELVKRKSGKDLVIRHEKDRSPVRRLIFDTEKARQLLEFEPHISLEEGIDLLSN